MKATQQKTLRGSVVALGIPCVDSIFQSRTFEISRPERTSHLSEAKEQNGRGLGCIDLFPCDRHVPTTVPQRKDHCNQFLAIRIRAAMFLPKSTRVGRWVILGTASPDDWIRLRNPKRLLSVRPAETRPLRNPAAPDRSKLQDARSIVRSNASHAEALSTQSRVRSAANPSSRRERHRSAGPNGQAI